MFKRLRDIDEDRVTITIEDQQHEVSSGDLWKTLQFLFQNLFNQTFIRINFLEKERQYVFIHQGYGLVDVFVFNLLMAEFLGQLLCLLNGFL